MLIWGMPNRLIKALHIMNQLYQVYIKLFSLRYPHPYRVVHELTFSILESFRCGTTQTDFAKHLLR